MSVAVGEGDGSEGNPQPEELSDVWYAVGALAVSLEARYPGIIDDAVKRLENEATRSAVVRLRGPRVSQDTRDMMRCAASKLATVGLFAIAELGPLIMRRKRKKG